jgi:hypothetical protein
MNNIIEYEQIILLREHYKSIRTKPIVVRTKTYGCGNKSMVVGTKTYGCGNKPMVVGTNLWLWEH